MAMMRYMVVVEHGDTSWGAHVPDSPGCVAVGETREEVLRLIREAIEFHIDGLKQDGLPVPPLFFFRPYRRFWIALSVAGLVVAGTALAAFFNSLTWRFADAHSVGSAWSALASRRILITPLFALAFLVCAVFASSRRPRRALLAATAVEASVFVSHVSMAFRR
jgi:predicted RNase H-like HicB family nuclease